MICIVEYTGKYKYAYVLIILFSVCASCDQAKFDKADFLMETDTLPASSDYITVEQFPKDVDEIRKFFAIWEKKEQQGIFKKQSLDYSCQNEKNGKVTYFFEEDDLSIIEHQYSEYDHFSAIDRYYVIDGKPYFIYSMQSVWSFEAEGQTKDNVKEYRGYIINSEVVKCLEKKYILRSYTDNNPDPDYIPSTTSDCKKIQKLIAKYEKLVEFQQRKIFNYN